MGQIAGKIAIVTGAGAGIGRAIALRFAAEGARVLAADISGQENRLAGEAKGEVVPMHCDMAKPDDVAAVIEACKARFGRLDILVNNAGIGSVQKPLHEIAFEEWDKVMAVNVRGAFAALKYGLPLMIKSGGGAVVNLASIGSFRAAPLASPYITSKGAMLMLTKQAALEYAQDNIRVNAVCPGTTATPILANTPPDMLAFLEGRIPMSRLGTPEEVANVALFLASDQASFVTGAYFIVDGGICAGTGRPPHIARHIE